MLSYINKEFFDILESSPIFPGSCPNSVDDISKLTSKIKASNKLLISSLTTTVPSYWYHVEKLHERLEDFWNKNWEQYITLIKKLPASCIIAQPNNALLLEGEVQKYFPFFENILFIDELTYAALHLKKAKSQFDYENLFKEQMYSYLGFLMHKKIFLENKDNPCGFICPPQFIANEEIFDRFQNDAINNSLLLFSEMADEELYDGDKILRHYKKYGIEGFHRNPALSDAVIWGGDEGLEEYVDSRRYDMERHGGVHASSDLSDIELLFYNVASRFSKLLISLSDSMVYDQDPSIQSDDWGLYQWLIGKKSKEIALNIESNIDEDQLFSIGVQSNFLSWLHDVPIEKINLLRKDNTITAIREDFKTGRLSIKNSEAKELTNVAEKIGEYLNDKITEYGEQLKQLEKETLMKRQQTLVKIGVTSVIACGGALYPPLSIPSAIFSIVVGGSAIKDFLSEAKSKKELEHYLRRRPLGFLYELREDASS